MTSQRAKKSETVRKFIGRQPRAPSFRLFCFPHAGGGSTFFRDWAGLSSAIEVCPIQLPGHEDRLREAPVATIQEAADLVLSELRHQLDLPFAFFGHSMGALVCYEVALQLQRRELPGPRFLFVSGYSAPHLEAIYGGFEALSDDDLLRALINLGGVPLKILHLPEVLAAVLPVVRADIACCARYRPTLDGAPLDGPIVGFCGATDPLIKPDDMRGWRAQTRGSFVLHTMPGGHFFLKQNLPSVFAEIASTLTGSPSLEADDALSSRLLS